MITISRCFGFITVVALLCAMCALNGGYYAPLVDIPTFCFVVFGTLAILLIGSDASGWSSVVKVVFRHKSSRTDQATHSAVLWFSLASRASISCGMIWGVFVLIQFIADASPIRPAIALALLGPAYGLILSEFIFHPLAVALRSRE